jgi:DNA-binding transcriptional ArsR family regulator
VKLFDKTAPSGEPPPTIDVSSKVLALAPSPPPMVLVRRILMEVLDVVLTFPEGITSQGISQLTGVRVSTISHRLTRLKRLGLVESVEHSINWRATGLARKAKLVAS